jgi:hypothetical protein
MPLFTEADLKHLLTLTPPPRNLHQLTTNPGGLTTTASALSRLTTSLLHSPEGRTTIFALASHLSLDLPTTTKLLSTLPTDTHAKCGEAVILTAAELGRLRRMLAEALEVGIVVVAEFCARQEVEEALVLRLLAGVAGAPVAWGGGVERKWCFLPRGFERAVEEVEVKLWGVQEPVALGEVVEGPREWARMVGLEAVGKGRLEGCVEGERFVPECYVGEKREELVGKLRKEGVLGVQEVEEVGLKDMVGFVREKVQGVKLLGAVFVTQGFVARVLGEVLGGVEESGWGVVKVCFVYRVYVVG